MHTLLLPPCPLSPIPCPYSPLLASTHPHLELPDIVDDVQAVVIIGRSRSRCRQGGDGCPRGCGASCAGVAAEVEDYELGELSQPLGLTQLRDTVVAC